VILTEQIKRAAPSSLSYRDPSSPKSQAIFLTMTTADFLSTYRPHTQVNPWGKHVGAHATFNHAPDWNMPDPVVRPGVNPCEPAMQIVALGVSLDRPITIDDPEKLKAALNALRTPPC
jgi:hypothetical protein